MPRITVILRNCREREIEREREREREREVFFSEAFSCWYHVAVVVDE